MTKVRIKNFQSIGDASIDIDGFTVVVGKNNIGKSALVRAIDAALTNRTGNEFIRRGTKKSEVSVQHADLDIIWEKGSKASYKVNDVPYTALGRSVPQPVEDAGFRKMEVGNEKLNPILASQFKPLFLLDKPGSAITEALSKMYKLNIISKADDLCQKEIRRNKTLLRTREADLKEVDEKLERFKDFENTKKEIERLAFLNSKIEHLRTEVAQIQEYDDRIKQASDRITSLQAVSGVDVPSTDGIDETMGHMKMLDEWGMRLREIATSVKRMTPISDVSIPDKDLGIFDNLIRDYEEIDKLRDTMERHAKEITTKQQELQEIESDLNQAQKEWDSMEVCPLCERPK